MTVSLIAARDRTLLALTEVRASEAANSPSNRDRALALRDAASACAAQAAQFAFVALPPRD